MGGGGAEQLFGRGLANKFLRVGWQNWFGGEVNFFVVGLQNYFGEVAWQNILGVDPGAGSPPPWIH